MFLEVRNLFPDGVEGEGGKTPDVSAGILVSKIEEMNASTPFSFSVNHQVLEPKAKFRFWIPYGRNC